MKRRNFLAGTAASVIEPAAAPASAQDGTPTDVAVAVPHIRASIPANFDDEYLERVVIRSSLTSIYAAERSALPMIDTTLSKENALPQDLWGLIYQGWKSSPGVRTVSIMSPE